jgi:hypothetical protein
MTGQDAFLWLLDNRRRAALALAAIVIIAILGTAGACMATGAAGGHRSNGRGASANRVDVGRTGGPVKDSDQPSPSASSGDWETATESFVQQWGYHSSSQTVADWIHGMRPYITAELAQQFANADLDGIPSTHIVTGPVPVGTTGRQVVSRCGLSDGTMILVTAVLDGERWLVADVQDDKGDAGDGDITGSLGVSP